MVEQPRHEPSPADWVDLHGDALYRFALVHVRDAGTAEDLVQECLLSALDARERYQGQASERTWLIGILKHKVVDHFRRQRRDRGLAQASPEADPPPSDSHAVTTYFSARGLWRSKPAAWPDSPADNLERDEFWHTLRGCLDKLPLLLSRAFLLRELDDLSNEEVCQVLEVTPTNLWARLHRARLGLRQCLESHGFGRDVAGEKGS